MCSNNMNFKEKKNMIKVGGSRSNCDEQKDPYCSQDRDYMITQVDLL